MKVPTRVAAFAMILAVPAVASCGSGGAEEASVSVFAAASMTDAFEELADAFEAEAGIDVDLTFGASSALRASILDGAPADVFASADAVDMDLVVDAGAAADAPVVVATNRLELVVPEGNPAGVAGLGDLARADLLVGLCAPEVPCGRLAGEALRRAGVTAAPDTEAPDVRSLLTQVAAGELDVGVAYRTDVLAARDQVDGLALDGPAAVEARCPIVVLGATDERAAADALVAFVRSSAGQRILRGHGFGPP